MDTHYDGVLYIISSFQNSGSDYVEISGLENYFNLHKGSMCCDQS